MLVLAQTAEGAITVTALVTIITLDILQDQAVKVLFDKNRKGETYL